MNIGNSPVLNELRFIKFEELIMIYFRRTSNNKTSP